MTERTTRPPSPLALLRLRAGLSQDQVAKVMKRDRSHLSRIEQGRYPIRPYVKRLAETYGVEEEEVREAWEASKETGGKDGGK